jgi:tol-pal system protein YbgF
MAHHPLSGILFALAVVGCATTSKVARDDDRRLSETVDELRGDRRVQDRKIRDLERQLTALKAQKVSDVEPPLPVEVVLPPVVAATAAPAPNGDGDERVVGIADDGSEIVYTGDAASGRAASPEPDGPVAAGAPAPRRHGHAVTSDDHADHGDVGSRHVAARATHGRAARGADDAKAPRLADAPGERTAAAGDPGGEYRAAVALLKGGDAIGAVTALRAFLARYPRHDYADNAQYWIGEAYYAQQDYGRAMIEFRATIETYPRGNKVPDALLKVGYCYLALGQGDKAHAVLQQVVSLYPKTPSATIAAQRLETP